MKNVVLFLLVILVNTAVIGQVTPTLIDSDEEQELVVEEDTSENFTTLLVNQDSLREAFINLDPDLVADRLSCIQGEIPLNYFAPVHRIARFYVADRHTYTEKLIARANFYFPIFEEYLKKYNLPEELKYLAIVESGLVPTAVSRSGAVGLWQFVTLTGKSLKLKIDPYIDERRDIHKSTEAACKYLSSLYKTFGDWELALAAYNCGPGYVRRAQKRMGYKKSFKDIYKYLPRETRAYVPSFVAVAYAFNYADLHGLHPHPDSVLNWTYDTIVVQNYVNLIKLAEMIDEPYESIERLNPALKVTYIPSHYQDFVLCIPQDKKQCFEENRDEIMDSVSKRKFERIEHIVRPGQSLSWVASKYGVSIQEVKEWNGLTSNYLKSNQKLIIWKTYGSRIEKSDYLATASKNKIAPPKYKGNKQVYIVQPGDTLWSISQRKSLTVDQLMQINKLKSKSIKPGQRLLVG